MSIFHFGTKMVRTKIKPERLSRLTEDGSVDDVRVREADFDGVLLVSDPVDLDGDDFVGEDDVSVGVEDHLETEGGRA